MSQGIPELVESLHDLISKQVPADVAVDGLISAAGEIVLGMAVANPDRKDAYVKVFNSSMEQVRRQLARELKSRRL